MTGSRKAKKAMPWRWAVGVAFVLLTTATLYVAILVYPTPLFAHHQRIGAFQVHSDRALSLDVEALVADVAERLNAFDGGPGSGSYRVYLCHDPRRYGLFARLTRRTARAQAIGLGAPGNIFVSMPRLAEFAAHQGGLFVHSRFSGSPAFAVAHEIAHFRIIDRLGLDASRSLPEWKSEGWADYQANLAGIRRDPDYDLARRIDLLDEPRYWADPRLRARQFFAWQLLVEYLAEVRGYGFEQLRRPSVTESETRAEMRAWRRGHRPARGGPPQRCRPSTNEIEQTVLSGENPGLHGAGTGETPSIP